MAEGVQFRLSILDFVNCFLLSRLSASRTALEQGVKLSRTAGERLVAEILTAAFPEYRVYAARMPLVIPRGLPGSFGTQIPCDSRHFQSAISLRGCLDLGTSLPIQAPLSRFHFLICCQKVNMEP